MKKLLKELNFIDYRENELLSKHSTMRVGGRADFLIEIKSEEVLDDFVQIYKDDPALELLVIGEGSNTLFTGDFKGIVLKIMHRGIEKIDEDDEYVTLKVQGGHNWHEFVEYCVEHNLAGNENLAFIPGTVGAAPVQNIAAYGQVQEDTFLSLEALNIETGEKEIFDEPECEFAYRSSVFKTSKNGKYIITNVTYKMKKASEYIPETSYHSRYESLSQFLPEDKTTITLKDIFNAVIAIRKHKLPQVEEEGTLGSFFVNPFVTKIELEKLKMVFPNIQYYPVDKMQYPALDLLKDQEIVKIPAGWLLEELGWRGKREGNVGTSPKHALCLTVTGPADGKEVLDFMEAMKKDVKEKTGINLKSEVNVI